MSSITGLKKGKFTSINNSGEIRLGTTIDPGTPGEAIISGGPNQPVTWGTHTGTINPLTAGTNITYTSGNPTFDGSVADTINSTDTDTTYSAGSGIDLTGTTFSTDNDGTTIDNSGAGNTNQVLKVPQDLTINATTYNGSVARNFTLATTDTTYIAGLNIYIDTTTTPDTIQLLQILTDIQNITFQSAGYGSTITGNSYASSETVCTYLDLTSPTNLMPTPASPFLSTKIMETNLLRYIYTTYYEYSTSFRTAFVAQSANVMVEFRAIIRCDNRLFYGGLYDYVAGAYHAGSRTRFNYNDETDQDYTTITWWLNGLTPGSTYYITPYFRTHINYSYIYAGSGGVVDGYAPAIFRVIDGGSNVTIY